MAEIENLTIGLTANADEVVRSLTRLLNAIKPLGGAGQAAAGGLKNLTDAAEESGNMMKQAGKDAGEAEPEIKKFGKSADNAGKSTKIASVGIKDFWKALTRVNIVKMSLVDLPKYFGDKLISNVTNATKNMSQFFNSIKRIALYRLIRTALKEMTQGFSEGIKNLYDWSTQVDRTFATSMDRLATSTTYLKNSLAAMVSPLINSLAPAIDFIIDKFVDMYNIVNQIFARLSGRDSYTAAKKVATQWQDASQTASDSAKKAANEIKRTILGFDEINKLNGATANNGGIGSGTNISDNTALMFENRSISNWIKEMVDGGDFSAIGGIIAGKINDALNGINWQDISNKSFQFVHSITSLINGFINQINPDTVGEAIANIINTGAARIDQFWSEIDWAMCGSKIHDILFKMFVNVDFAGAANALTAKFTSLVTLVKNALPQNQSEWNTVGSKISTFIQTAIKNISKSDIGTVIGNMISGAFSVMTILAEEGTLTNIATGIKNVIGDACKQITPEQVQTLVSSVLKDVLDAVSVLMSINIKIGDVSMGALSLIAFTTMATNILKKAVGNIFGANVSSSGLGQSLAFAASMALMLDVGVKIASVISDVKNGNKISLDTISGILQEALMGTGLLFVSKGSYKVGLLLFGLGIAINPIMNEITNIKNDINKNGITWDSFKKILGDALLALGIGTMLFINPLAGAVAIGVGVVLRLNIIDTILEGIYSENDRLKDQEIYQNATKRIANKKDYTIPLTVDAIPGQAMTLTNNSLAPIASNTNTTNTVNGVSGKGMVDAWGLFKPNVDNTTTTNIVNGVAGNNIVDVWGLFEPKVGDTTTTNTLNGVAGNGYTLSWNTFNPNVKDTITTNTVNGKAGNGYTLDWGTFNPNISDTSTVNTINAVPGDNMEGGWWGLWAKVNDSSTTVDVNLWKTWWGEDPIDYLELNDLKTTVTVDTKLTGAITKLTSGKDTIGRAVGGAFFGGMWHDIPQYANGTTNAHGSLFLAGEAGPEIVGHVGGRTEVLNKSQLAAAMYSAVHSAMQGVTLDANFYGNGSSNSDGGGMTVDINDGKIVTLLNEVRGLLMQINDKELSVSTTAMNKAQSYMNRRAGATIVPVGT